MVWREGPWRPTFHKDPCDLERLRDVAWNLWARSFPSWADDNGDDREIEDRPCDLAFVHASVCQLLLCVDRGQYASDALAREIVTTLLNIVDWRDGLVAIADQVRAVIVAKTRGKA